MTDTEKLGQIAYQAYCDATGDVSLVSGAPLPAWDALAEKIRAAWICAAIAVAVEQLEATRKRIAWI